MALEDQGFYQVFNYIIQFLTCIFHSKPYSLGKKITLINLLMRVRLGIVKVTLSN